MKLFLFALALFGASLAFAAEPLIVSEANGTTMT